MFDIISKDQLRRSVEQTTQNKCTVLYDSKGLPNFMSVVPQCTLGDVFSDLSGINDVATAIMDSTAEGVNASSIHPAFKVSDDTGNVLGYVNEIFVSQYRNTIFDGIAVSLPGLLPSTANFYEDGTYTIRESVENKGSNWHVMNALESTLLTLLSCRDNVPISGNQYGTGYDYNGECGSVGNYHMVTSVDPSTFDVGEKIYGLTSGAEGFVTGTSLVGGVDNLVVSDVYNKVFINGETIVGRTSDTTATIDDTHFYTYNGSGPLTWTNNHKFSGIWDLASFGWEVIDGARTRRLTGNTGANHNFHMFEVITDTNYYHYNDTLLYRTEGKLSETGICTNILQLGYSALDGTNLPVEPVNADRHITNVADFGTVGEAFNNSALYDSSSSIETRIALVLAGVEQDNLVYPNGTKIVYNGGLFVKSGDGAPDPTSDYKVLTQGFKTNSIYNGLWTKDMLRMTNKNNQMTFRSVYIPQYHT